MGLELELENPVAAGPEAVGLARAVAERLEPGELAEAVGWLPKNTLERCDLVYHKSNILRMD